MTKDETLGEAIQKRRGKKKKEEEMYLLYELFGPYITSRVRDRANIGCHSIEKIMVFYVHM